MAYPATPKTWVAGDVLTAAQLNAELRDALLGAFPLGPPDAAWTAYTPTLAAATLGNGTLAGRYTRIGRTITATARFVLGSTSSVSGAITMALPVLSANQGVNYIGKAYYQDAATRDWVGIVIVNPNDTVARPAHTESGNFGDVNGTNPFTFGTGDSISFTVTYESAT